VKVFVLHLINELPLLQWLFAGSCRPSPNDGVASFCAQHVRKLSPSTIFALDLFSPTFCILCVFSTPIRAQRRCSHFAFFREYSSITSSSLSPIEFQPLPWKQRTREATLHGSLTLPAPPLAEHCWYDNQIFDTPAPKNKTEWKALFQNSKAEHKDSHYQPSSPTFVKLQMIASLCNNANFLTSTSSGVIDLDLDMLKPDFNLLTLDCSGDASEQGLTKFVEPIRSTRDYREKNPKIFEIKFNSTNKWQLSIHKQVRRPSSHEVESEVVTGSLPTDA
jgi:hypothetical protein